MKQTRNILTRYLLGSIHTALVMLAILGFQANDAVGGEINTTFLSKLAIEGHDPVAYFKDGKPIEGNSDFRFEWKGAIWQFANAANRDDFVANPERFAPQYGGYCAWAASQGYTANGDPAAWTIAEGRLFLNYNKRIQATWEMDIASNVRKGDANWPKLRESLLK